jgi:opacity protein-like surface antigen
MRKLILILALITIPATLFAQDDSWRNRGGDRDDRGYGRYDNSFELTPFAGYHFGGTIYASNNDIFRRDLDVAGSLSYGASFGIPLGSPLKLVLMVDHQSTHLTTGDNYLFAPATNLGDFDITYYHAGLQIPFARSRGAEPYVIVSAGIANLDPQVSGATSDNRFSASAGVGVRLPINRNVGLRVEGRGFYTSVTNQDDRCTFCENSRSRELYQGEVNIGMSFRF